MRIVEPTLKMFLSEIEKVEALRAEVKEASEEYLRHKHRDGPNNWMTKDWRGRLENGLIRYKRELSKIYDMMHDRGLTDFESGVIDRSDPRFYPLKTFEAENEEADNSDQFLYWQLMSLNAPIRGLDGRPRANAGGSPETDNGVGPQEIESGQQSTVSIQSARIATTVGSGEATQEVSSDKTEKVSTVVPSSEQDFIFWGGS